MSNEVEIISDGDGFAVIGCQSDVERFLLDQGLDQVPSKNLDLNRLTPALRLGGAATKVFVENSGRWVKLTPESAKAVRQFGLMATKTPGVSHAMIGKPGEIKQWIQIAKGPALIASGPLGLVLLSTAMQQRAMQQQMDEMLDYLKQIDAKVDDILRGQRDAVLADMIGVDLIVEDALTVRDETGRVSEVTWSKIQGTSMTVARTQAYAVRQLDAIGGKLEKTSDPGEMAKAAKDAEAKAREWLAVLARSYQLQDGISVLELDRVLDASPEELEKHRLGLIKARQNRLEVVSRTTAHLLSQMEETARRANSKVLFNPLKSPATVRASNQVATDVLDFRGRLGLDSEHLDSEAKRWSQAAVEVRDHVVSTTAEGVSAACRVGAESFDYAAQAFRAVDNDGDGVPEKPRALSAVEDAGSAIKGAAAGTAGAIGSGAKSATVAVGGLASGAAGVAGSLFKRKPRPSALPESGDSNGAGSQDADD